METCLESRADSCSLVGIPAGRQAEKGKVITADRYDLHMTADSDFKWGMIICDEATTLRNPSSVTWRMIQAVHPRGCLRRCVRHACAEPGLRLDRHYEHGLGYVQDPRYVAGPRGAVARGLPG